MKFTTTVYMCAFVAAFSILSLAQLPYLTTEYRDNSSTLPVPEQVFAVGDVNADGVPDYALRLVDSSIAGGNLVADYEVIVYSGASNSVLYILATNLTNSDFGSAIVAGGDVNNDGFGDILIGEPQFLAPASGTEPGGRVLVYSGADGSVIHSVLGAPGDSMGYALAAMDDMNGDGNDDYLVGAPARISQAFTQDGHARIISGVDGSTIHSFPGGPNSHAGFSVANMNDVNGDGVNDVAVGEPRHLFVDPALLQAGRVKIYSGLDGSLLHLLRGTDHLSNCGWDIANIGDLDSDGVDDIAIGEPSRFHPVTMISGRIRIFSGATGNLFRIHQGVHYALGREIANAGDVNGDGFDDLAAVDGENTLAVARLYSGADGAIIKTFPPIPDGNNYMKIIPVGDQNGDGRTEVFVLSKRVSENGNVILDSDNQMRAYTSGKKPIEKITSSSGAAPLLSLNWLPAAGHNLDLEGELQCAGVTPGGLGVVLVSYAAADIPVFGTDLLVAVDSINLARIATIGANSIGRFVIPDLTRRLPILAGFDLYVQCYETSPNVRASNSIRFTALP